eukprot:143358_1
MAARRVTLLFQQPILRSRAVLSTISYHHNLYNTHSRYSNLVYYSRYHFSPTQSLKEEEALDEYESTEETESEQEDDALETDEEDGDETEDHETEQEDEFIYGIDSDDEFSETLPYDVREDPWWDEMLPATQQKYLFMQRHKNPDAWPNQIIPHAAKTSHFNHSTIKALKRYPNLGKYSQRYTADADGRWNWSIDNVKLNTIEQIENGVLYNQPKYKQIMPMIHRKEVARWKNPEIDYRVKSGDVIELVMYTNLQKKKTTKINALCLMVKKRWEIAGSFMIRNVEKDGLTVIRQYPLHSPWIKSLQIKQRYKVKRRKLYYMYKAPAKVTDPVAYGDSIGVRSRSEHFKWLKETEEGMKYARDYKLKRRMYFHGMRYRQGWARRLADLYNATAITKNMKGPYKNARREMKHRLKAKPHKIA